MNIIPCIIKGKLELENGDFYVIEEIVNQNQYYIPSKQIDIISGIKNNSTYNFYIDNNNAEGKPFLNLIHPKYEIGSQHKLTIVDKKTINEKEYFEIKSDYLIPIYIKALPWQNDFREVLCKVRSYKRGIPQFENIDTSHLQWKIGEIKPFEIIGFSDYYKKDKNVKTVVLKIDDYNTITVNSGKWHKENLWNFKDLYCEVIGFSSMGLPKVVINDNRHPLYKKNEIYTFQINSFKKKLGKDNKEYSVIELSDNTDVKYEVLAIPYQETRLKIGDSINCQVIDINYNLLLKQSNLEDPFYYDFEDIIADNKYLKEKYFLNYLNNDNEQNFKLKSQYEAKSGFWLFTYCNYILKKIRIQCDKRKDLKETLEIIDLHSRIEKWILNKGILKSIKNQEERKLIKLKTQQIILINDSEKKALQYILNFDYSTFFNEQEIKTDFISLYFYLKHLDLNLINNLQVNKILINTLEKNIDIDSLNYHFLKRIINHIIYSTNVLKSYLQRDYFILNKKISKHEKQKISDYLIWQYNVYLLYKILGEIENANLTLSKIYRFSALLSDNIEDNKSLLLNSFYIVSNINNHFNSNINIDNNIFNININKINKEPNGKFEIDLNKNHFKINIFEKQSRGFLATLNNTKGFLPTQNITDNELKHYRSEEIDWSINAEITLSSIEFNYFIAKQIEKDSPNFYSKNNLEYKFAKSGDIIYGTIINTTEYGFFVSTKFGDGLVHISEISSYYFDKNQIQYIFKKGMRLPLYVLNHINDKLQLSLSKLFNTEYEKYYLYSINYLDLDEVENETEEEFDFNSKIELEKGYIFESYAILQNSLEEKIKYIKFAKAFFSNTFSARSYLLNIYLNYFESLDKLDSLLKNYSFNDYKNFRNYINLIKEKIQPKTLENFPESKNLIFFIEILSLFNSQNENDIKSLFDITQRPIEEDDFVLKTVAKSALANNLIISELNAEKEENEINEFTYKNLKRIREYISQGVLSIKETEEDILAKELNEKIKYWLNMISQDEGEKLEFKATLLTPIPDNQKGKIIASLKNQLKKNIDENSKTKIIGKIKEIEDETNNVKGIEKILIYSAFKTICAFANTNGGFLLLGVSDDKKIFGLEQDYNSFTNNQNRDEFGKKFDSLISDYFGDSFSSSYLEKEFLKFPDGDILIIKVNKSVEEVFMLKNEKGEKEESLFVRNLSSTKKLIGIELSKFIKSKLKQQLFDN